MTNVKAIIQLLDRHLEITGAPFIEPPEANVLLASNGILRDNTTRPGKPLRDLLRKGALPHAYQENGRWRIPHSQQRGICQAMPKTQKNEQHATKPLSAVSKSRKENRKSHESANDLDSVLFELGANRFDPASSDPVILPNSPGVYLICLKRGAHLPKTAVAPSTKPFQRLQVIYAGISKRSIRRRDYRQHFNGTAGGSTLRKSLGVLMNYQLIPRDKDPQTGKTTFSKADEAKLSKWMQSNLLMFYYPTPKCNEIELKLIQHFDPPLNLKDATDRANGEFRHMLKHRRILHRITKQY